MLPVRQIAEPFLKNFVINSAVWRHATTLIKSVCCSAFSPFLEENLRLIAMLKFVTETPEVVEKRLTEALSEIKRAEEYDYIVVNDVLDEAVEDIAAIIASERLRLSRQYRLINEILG